MEYTSAGVILINMNSKVLIVQRDIGGFQRGIKRPKISHLSIQQKEN